MIPTQLPLQRGFAKIPHVSPHNIRQFSISAEEEKGVIKDFCKKLQEKFTIYKWKTAPCGKVHWKADLKTRDGHPLIYISFGHGKDTTLFMGGVHPDELTPIHLSFRFARYLAENPDLYLKNGYKVIVAPLVNPDGFLRRYPSRTNKIVDVNRNFFTIDWYEKANKAWLLRRNGKLRYFPGFFPNTEVETLFQVKLLDRFKPDKIFSVHAPLGFLDYDGPGDQKPVHLTRLERNAKQFVYAVSKKTSNYRVVDYSFYPGSLGNYAGNERNLPTITLELKTTTPSKVEEYWQKFLPGFMQSVRYPFRKKSEKLNENATRFFNTYDHLFLDEQESSG